MLKKIGFVLGVLGFLAARYWPDSDPLVSTTLAVAILMVIWWVTEAVPIPVTALLPVVLFPVFGICDFQTAAAPFAKDYIFLFLGGFMLALGLEKHGLHKFIALNILLRVGTQPRRVLLGMMLATGFLSMWISNTATAVMMLPIAFNTATIVEERGGKGITVPILLGVAYSASIGGMATLIGSPPNLVMAGILSAEFGTNISFAEWSAVGLPFAAILLLLCYLLLRRGLQRSEKEVGDELRMAFRNELGMMARLNSAQKRVLAIFILTCVLWVFKDLLSSAFGFEALTDPFIGLAGGMLMFMIPSGEQHGKSLLSWEDTDKLPWGILLLFGGGLSLAEGLSRAGVIDAIGHHFLAMSATGIAVQALLLISIAVFLTELMSNVALVTVFVPVVAAIAVSSGVLPQSLCFPVTLAASAAFMLPMATPPNAIVFATGRLSIKQMAGVGFILNIFTIIILWLFWQFGAFSWF